MRHLVSLLAIAVLLAVPTTVSAHERHISYQGPMSGGTHNLTCDEAKFIGAANMGGYHGGVLRLGDCQGTASAWPYWESAVFGWRAQDGTLHQTRVAEYYCFCQYMTFTQDDYHKPL